MQRRSTCRPSNPTPNPMEQEIMLRKQISKWLNAEYTVIAVDSESNHHNQNILFFCIMPLNPLRGKIAHTDKQHCLTLVVSCGLNGLEVNPDHWM